MSASIPVLVYHAVAPGERVDPNRFRSHLEAMRRSKLQFLSPRELEKARSGLLLTFDDGFADLWTHGLPLLQEYGARAVVFAIPSRAEDGPPRPQGGPPRPGGSRDVHAEASRSPGPHAGFLRWSELEALEATGLVTVESHSYSHAAGWVGEEILAFHLGEHGRAHWSLAQCTGGDERLGIPLYRRGSALGHRLYRDDPELRDRLAEWMAQRGGEAYVCERGAEAVSRELRELASGLRAAGRVGRWESESERGERVEGEIRRAREALRERLGGERDALCLPWGEYDDITLGCARKAGIRRVYTLDRGPNPAGRIGFLVKRFEPRARGELWLRARVWIHRSSARAQIYAAVSGR